MLNVKDLIKKAKLENWTRLDLSGYGLEKLPLELFELTKLKSLTLGQYKSPRNQNRLTQLPPEILNLQNLEHLDVRDNRLTTLPIEFKKLKKLRILHLSNNIFTHFPEVLLEMPSLRELFIGNNRLTSLPRELSQLTNLSSLRLNGNEFKEIPEVVGEMKNLEYLYIHQNKLKNFPVFIPKLEKLRQLDARNNHFTSIPFELMTLTKLEELYLFGNPIVGIPIEVLGQKPKDNCLNDLKSYIQDLKEQGEEFVYEAKLILVGEAEAGKTTLSKKFRNPFSTLDREESMTKGIEIETWEFDFNENQKFTANIWDFGGQDIMHATHRYFLSKRALYVLVVDIRAEKTDFYYWLNIVSLFGNNSPVIIVLNEKHGYSGSVPEAITSHFSSIIRGVFNVNLASNKGLSELTEFVQSEMRNLPHIGKESIPKKHLDIRDALLNLHKNSIKLNDYLKICENNGIRDIKQALRISDLQHDLGTILHFQKDRILKQTVILNKSWATEAGYLVILDQGILENGGEFTFRDLEKIWNSSKYPAATHNNLLQLMLNFKICYEVRHKLQTYILPELLPQNPPTEVRDFESARCILFEIYYPKFMPKGIISKLIVEMNTFVYKGYQWKTGVILQLDRALIEIKEEYFNRKLILKVAGEDRRAALTIVRAKLWEINLAFENLQILEMVPCKSCLGNNAQEIHFFRRDTLEKYIQSEIPEIRCDICLKNQSIAELIDYVIGDEDRMEKILQDFKKKQSHPNTLKVELAKKLIRGEETKEVEFKATFHVPVLGRKQLKSISTLKSKIEEAKKSGDEEKVKELENNIKEIENLKKSPEISQELNHSAFKNLVAFANSDGGYLIIGVNEDENGKTYVSGIEPDLDHFKNKDEFRLKFDTLVNNQIGDYFQGLLSLDFIQINDLEVILIHVQPSKSPVFIKKDKRELFYIRRQGSAIELPPSEMLKYLENSKNG